MKKIGCTKYRKLDCKEPCRWLVGKGCKNPSPRSKKSSPRAKIKSPLQTKKSCTRLRKNDCTDPCEWTVGKGCKIKIKPVSEEMKTIQWDNNPDVYMGNLENCIQDIVINNYLGHGNYGMVYSIKYKNENCALKIIPMTIEGIVGHTVKKLIKNPLLHYTPKSKIKDEITMLETLSKNGVSPQLYTSGICTISLFFGGKEYLARVGYLVSEQFDETVRRVYNRKMNEFRQSLNQNLKEAEHKFLDSIKLFSDIDKQINKTLKISAKLGIHNFDTHFGNIMVKYVGNKVEAKIIDWGLAQTDKTTTKRLDEYGRKEVANKFISDALAEVRNTKGPKIFDMFQKLN